MDECGTDSAQTWLVEHMQDLADGAADEWGGVDATQEL